MTFVCLILWCKKLTVIFLSFPSILNIKIFCDIELKREIGQGNWRCLRKSYFNSSKKNRQRQLWQCAFILFYCWLNMVQNIKTWVHRKFCSQSKCFESYHYIILSHSIVCSNFSRFIFHIHLEDHWTLSLMENKSSFSVSLFTFS